MIGSNFAYGKGHVRFHSRSFSYWLSINPPLSEFSLVLASHLRKNGLHEEITSLFAIKHVHLFKQVKILQLL